MKYIRWRAWFLILGIVVAVLLLLKLSTGPGMFQSSKPITDSQIMEVYPDLYKAISQRDAGLLIPFLTHENRAVQKQAWRAMAVTPVDSLRPFIRLAAQQNSELAWFGISQQAMAAGQLRQLEALWVEEPSRQEGIARVLGQQGDQQSLHFLLRHLNDQISNEFSYALAVGRLAIHYELPEKAQIKILQQAFSTGDAKTIQAYLYGWYRGAEQQLSPAAQDTLFNRWRVFGIGLDAQIDQYVNHLLPERTTATIAAFYNGEQWLEDEVQLSIELAQSLDKVDLNSNTLLAAKILLVHPNPHVQKQTLESLAGKLDQNGDLVGYIKNSMVADSSRSDIVWLQALEILAAMDSSIAATYRAKLDKIPEENIYLTSNVLAIYKHLLSPEEYLQQIEAFVERERSLFAMEALQQLALYWQNLSADEKTDSLIATTRQIIFQALDSGDRGIAYISQPLLLKEDLFYDSDFEQINRKLAAFSLPADIEVYQQFGRLYKQRFEEQAREVIDSLSALNYAPLNRSLKDAGWPVKVIETKADFRLPDWERLWKLGKHPVLTLHTQKGDIEIRMNTLSAPATISAIDSLSRAGAYAGVPFHRVVPNFVIQGGDIERKDGFGGPDFVLPTEPSSHGFTRGAVGIASAGPDTEGSQYFIMHQWSPHLNGNYTLFGEVVEGMEVVDRIIPGDRVLSTTWY